MLFFGLKESLQILVILPNIILISLNWLPDFRTTHDEYILSLFHSGIFHQPSCLILMSVHMYDSCLIWRSRPQIKMKWMKSSAFQDHFQEATEIMVVIFFMVLSSFFLILIDTIIERYILRIRNFVQGIKYLYLICV